MTAPAIPRLADSCDYLLSKQVRDVVIGAAMGQTRLSREQTSELNRQFGRVYRRSLRHYQVTGEVYPCAMLIRSCQRVARPALAHRLAAMSLGPVTRPDVLAKRLGTLASAARAAGIFGPQARKQSRLARCATCRFAGDCLICPIACAKNPDSADPNRIPDFQCAFNRIAFEYRRRFPRQY